MSEQETVEVDPEVDEVAVVDAEVVETVEIDEEADEVETDDADETELGAPSLGAALEALLLLADEPMTVLELASAVRCPADDVAAVLAGLAEQYVADGRGFELREIAGGWRFYTAGSCSDLVQRYVHDGQQARLTQAALETLAVIAYRQPITRSRVSAVRGVNVDGVVRTLVARGLVAESGSDGESGAHLYVTTSHFLERMGISTLAELPPLAEHLPDLADLEDLLDSAATGE